MEAEAVASDLGFLVDREGIACHALSVLCLMKVVSNQRGSVCDCNMGCTEVSVQCNDGLYVYGVWCII